MAASLLPNQRDLGLSGIWLILLPPGIAGERQSSLTRQSVSRMLRAVDLRRRCVVAIVMLPLVVGAPGLCAGWAAAPEARMACCASGESCAMDHSEDDGNAARAVTQSQADACCASSEPDGSTPSAAPAASAITVAVLGLGVVVPPSPPVDRFHPESFTDPPAVATAVARHVLLTVFLI